MSLENKLEKKSFVRKAVDYALPFLDKYDPLSEAEKLLEDVDIARKDPTVEELVPYLIRGRYKHKPLVNAAKVADTADKFTSIAGAVLEFVGVGFGAAPGFATNGVEEAAEMIFKLPFYLICRHDNPTKIPWLLTQEAATMAAPVAGDAYDMLRNNYMKTAHETIRESAKSEFLKDYVANYKKRPHLSLLDNRHESEDLNNSER